MIECTELEEYRSIGCDLLNEHLLNIGSWMTTFNDPTHIYPLVLLADDQPVAIG
jgi:hypothetical protein